MDRTKATDLVSQSQFYTAAHPHAPCSLRAVRDQHTRERQPKRQYTTSRRFIGIDSDTFLFQSCLKEAWECGHNNNNIEENSKDYQRVFDTDSSALCPQ